jgi:hypothetical protein
MKRGAPKKPKLVQLHNQYPYKNSPQSLTLDTEIKRIAEDRGESIGLTIKRLAEFSGITERQIYNYISGKCDIPSGQIPVFCREFGSNALAMTILQQCGETLPVEDYDIVRLANKSARETLQAHDAFLEVFDDGDIDGFELNKVKKLKAKAVANFNQLEQIAEDSFNRRRAA